MLNRLYLAHTRTCNSVLVLETWCKDGSEGGCVLDGQLAQSCFTDCLSLMCRVVPAGLTGASCIKALYYSLRVLVDDALQTSVITFQSGVQSGMSHGMSGAGASGQGGVCL